MVQSAGWKCFLQTNALAYYIMELVITVKKFYGTSCWLEMFSVDKRSSLLQFGLVMTTKKSYGTICWV